MYNSDGLIYKNTRAAAGFTQEKWAELLGVSVESVRCYENGTRVPPDDVVLRMVDVSGVQALGIQHLRQRSELGRRYVRELPPQSLIELVVMLNNRMRVFLQDEDIQTLLALAEDGQITQEEAPQFDLIMDRLEEIASISMGLKMGGFC